MKPILIAENIGKKYITGSNRHRDYAFKDLFRAIFLQNSNIDDIREEEFWALKNVSFTLYPGDSLGLIGKNGSGKSTLLKILNDLIRLDEGSIDSKGKIQALINLGAGFDKRLSGKENIFLSAALMSLSESQTKKIYKEVVEFSDLGDFIDSPVSSYSSGMYARLGFSIAINLNPDIILIDEILAVGDIAFQNKCFTRMHQLKSEGVTMILVSHSHAQISQFCESVLWLDEGEVKEYGESKEVLKKYSIFMDNKGADKIRQNLKQNLPFKSKEKKIQLYGAIYDEFDQINNLSFGIFQNNIKVDKVRVNSTVSINYSFNLKRAVTDLNISINIYTESGQLITTISTLNHTILDGVDSGVVNCSVEIHDLNINPGKYVVVMPIHEGHSYLYRDIVYEFNVISSNQLTWGLVNFDYSYSKVNI
jgi:ABC-type polysaccharide/polyol phosphate transport system ATPase subunit